MSVQHERQQKVTVSRIAFNADEAESTQEQASKIPRCDGTDSEGLQRNVGRGRATASTAKDATASASKGAPHKVGRTLLLSGAVLALLCILSGFLFYNSLGTADLSEAEIQQIMETGTSSTLEIGVVLDSSDSDVATEPTDYAIENTTGAETTTITIWDYASVDGDYVQVLVDGVAITDVFMIDHDPVEIEVPATGTVSVVGIHDGGGGLTYAAYCALNGEIYFNNAPEGVLNTYTFVVN